MTAQAGWTGMRTKECQLCGESLGETFVDGRTSVGVWAIMCTSEPGKTGCHELYGKGLGVGNGQLYRTSDGARLDAPTRQGRRGR